MRAFEIFSLMICLSHGLRTFVTPSMIRFPFRSRVRTLSTVDIGNSEISKKSDLKWVSSSKYKFGDQIGAGKYSHVIGGFCRESGRPVAIKVLKPCPAWKIKREVAILEALKGGPHIVELIDKIYNKNELSTVGNGTKQEDGKCYGLVFAHFGSSSSTSEKSNPLVKKNPISKSRWIPYGEVSSPRRFSHRGLKKPYTDIEVRWAMYQLFESLEYAHKNQIMHRDLKPANVLVSGRGYPNLQICVADWGLADIHAEGAQHAVRVASRPFKAPELLLGDPYYTCSADLWSSGCIFAGLLFNKDPFIKGKDNEEQISKLAQVLGSCGFKNYIKQYLNNDTRTIKSSRNDDEVKGTTILSDSVLQSIGSHRKLSWLDYAKKILNEDKEKEKEKIRDNKERIKECKHNKLKSISNQLNVAMIEEKMKLATPDALDLLNKLLCFDRNKRITATEAKQHAYFNPIRERM